MRLSDSGKAGSLRVLTFEQRGTHVSIVTDLDRERLIDFARSFAPIESAAKG